MCRYSFYSIIIILFLLLRTGVVQSQQEHTLSIKVTNGFTNKFIQDANVFLKPCNCGGVTNAEGLFSIGLPRNTYEIKISYTGYEDKIQTIELTDTVFLEVQLYQKEEQLSEIILTAKRNNDNVSLPEMGVLKLTAKELKIVPAALGEFDVLKSITQLAGVNNAGDVSNGISVRGGSLDQNLLLYDHAPVFNPTHLFGLFSVFTPDVLSSVDLYRGNIPSRYGGRATSVLDVKVKNPYIDKFKLSGGIGVVSGRLNVETPLIKDKLMLISGFRAGYTDFLLPIFSKRLKDTKARFSDGTIKLLYLPTEKDQISFTGFYSKDFYQLDLISKVANINAKNNQYDFKTLNGTINWLHKINEQTNLRTILLTSNYNAKTIFPEQDINNDVEVESKINYQSLISEFSKNVNEDFSHYTGIQINKYKISPGELKPGSSNSVNPVVLNPEFGYEFSGYGNIKWKALDYLTLSAGLRYTSFLSQGPYTLNTYDSGGDIVASEFFKKGEKVISYDGFEPRLGANLKLTESSSLKFSYARLNQYLQNIYNSTTPLPTSRWKISDPHIKPQISDMFGFGWYKNLKNNDIEIGIESYYRKSDNNLTYKPGADFFLEEFVERDVVQGEGKAYGVEFSFKKSNGDVNGWFNYTWSKTLLRTDSERIVDRVNNNKWYPSDFNRPHVLNGVLNLEGNKYNTFSFSFTGQTGKPYTQANGLVELDNIDVPIFLERNNARLRTYHRLDFSWNVHFSKSKKNKRWLNDWTFTIYNIYGRKNPLNEYYSNRDYTNTRENSIFGNSVLGSYELSVLNSPLVSLTYNFRFQ